MYAVASEAPEPVQMILHAGANPNQTSLRGDTPLMVGAFRGRFVEDLVHAGAKVNAQNNDGTSVLMILAAHGDSEEVDAALKHGAKPFLRDKKGRSALDYLRLANCGKSPVQDLIMSYPHSKGCDQLDVNDVQTIRQLLKAAVQ